MTDAPPRLRVLALEPWLGDSSHARFLRAWSARSRHDVEVLGLPDRHWKWRMRDGARALAERVSRREPPDVLFASDYLDVPGLFGFLPPAWGAVPLVLYVHENQLTYPAAPDDAERERDGHYAYTNVLSCLRAARVVFNSAWHRDAFASAGRELLRTLPDGAPRGAFDDALARAAVVWPGVELDRIPLGPGPGRDAPLRVVFNHRREHDKDPAGFLQAVAAALDAGLRAEGVELLLLGERFRREPDGHAALVHALERYVRRDAWEPDFDRYARLLGSADLVVSTARHEFFGMAAAEAMAAGCAPLLPARLAYPEVLGEAADAALYRSDDELPARLVDAARRRRALRGPAARGRWRAVTERLDATRTARALDELCTDCSKGAGSTGHLV